MVKEPNSMHSKSKHIALRKHWANEKVEAKEFEIKWIGTNNMIADIYTKPLNEMKFELFREAFTHAIQDATD